MNSHKAKCTCLAQFKVEVCLVTQLAENNHYETIILVLKAGWQKVNLDCYDQKH